MNFKETLEKCREFEFNEELTREMLWNEAYRLGRSRWYWGPMWWIDCKCWLRSLLSKLQRGWRGPGCV